MNHRRVFRGVAVACVAGVLSSVVAPPARAQVAAAAAKGGKSTVGAAKGARSAAKLAADADAAAAAAGFSIAPAPAWVKPVAVDSDVQLPAAALQLLVCDTQVRLGAGPTSRYLHYVRQVNDSSGLQRGGLIEIEFDPTYQKLVLNRLDIVRDGKRVRKLDAKAVKLLHRETQLERQTIDGRLTATIVLDDLRVGDRVEWEATIVGDNPVFGGRFADTEWSPTQSGPTGVMQYRLLAPVARDIHVRALDPAVQVTRSEQGGERETLLRRTGVPQFVVDPSVPPGEFLSSLTDLSEFADWAAVAAWSQEVFAPAMRPTPALDAEAERLKASATTPEGQMRAALDFVQRDIRYFGTEIGPSTHRPADVDTTLRQRFGDCKDKAVLLSALLQRMGFDATPVLVSLGFGKATARRLPSPLDFNHVIVRTTLDDRTVWLDATRDQQIGPIAARESRGLGVGLLARADTTALVDLPTHHDELQSESTVTLSFAHLAEPGKLDSVIVLHGDSAEFVRGAMARASQDEIDKQLAGDVQRAYPGVTQVGHVTTENVEADGGLRITSHYQLGDYWAFPNQAVLAGRIVLNDLIAPLRLPDEATRARPFALTRTGRFRQTVRLQFDEPIDLKPGGAHVDESSPQFELSIRGETGPRSEEYSGELHVVADEVAVADWPAYREKLNKVAPRLFGTALIPAMTPKQVEDLKAQGPRQFDALRRTFGRLPLPEEGQAAFRVLAMDAELAGTRLPPKLRAQALVQRGASLDTLGRSAEAQQSFAQAMALDAASADAVEGSAINAFMMGDDARADAQAQAALRLNPGSHSAEIVRFEVDYQAGRYAPARDRLTSLLQSRTEVERGYGTLWLLLSTRHLGGDAAAAVAPFMPAASKPEWPYPVLQYLQGRIDFDAAMKASPVDGKANAGRECELYYYAGEKALLDGDAKQARRYFQRSVDTKAMGFTEYVFASRELAKLPD